MKKTAKKLLSMALVLVMVLSLLPATAIAANGTGTAAVSTALTSSGTTLTNEYGFEITVPAGFDSDKTHPYGNGATTVNLSPVKEIGIFESSSYVWSSRVYNFTEDTMRGTDPNKNLFSSDSQSWIQDNPIFSRSHFFHPSTAMTTQVMAASSPLENASGTSLDASGDGRDNLVAYYGRNRTSGRLQLYVYATDKAGNGDTLQGASWTGSSASSYSWMSETTPYNNEGYLSIVSGDFDGDGKDTMILYDPAAGNLQLREFKVTNETNGTVSQVVSYALGSRGFLANLFGKTPNAIQKMSGNTAKARNTAMVQLAVGDVDRDYKDELIVTVSLTNMLDENGKITNRSSVLMVLDKNENNQYFTCNWVQQLKDVYDKDKTSPYSGTEGWLMRAASSAVGDIDGDGFPEILTVGVGSDDNADDDNFWSDGYFAVITEFTGKNGENGKYSIATTKNSDDGTVLKGYLIPEQTKDKNKDFVGTDSSDLLCMSPVSLGLVRFDGTGTQPYAVIRGLIYQYKDGDFAAAKTKDNNMDLMFRNRVIIRQPIVGNFDGNINGREQIFFAISCKLDNIYDVEIGGWYYDGNKSVGSNSVMEGKGLRSCRWQSAVANVSEVVLTAPDADNNDGYIATYTGKEYTCVDPEIMAILEAAPYFEDLKDDYRETLGGTTFGTGKGSGSGSSVQGSTRAGAYISYEQDISIFGIKIGSIEAEAASMLEWSWGVEKETEYEYTMEFDGGRDSNQVVLICTPVTIYHYDVYDVASGEWKPMDITLADQPVYTMMSVEEYNAVAKLQGDPIIGSDIVSAVPGQPNTYRTSTTGLKNVYSANQNQWMDVGHGSSTVTQSITKTSSSTFSNELMHSTDVKAGIGAGGFVVGLQAGVSIGGGWSTTDTSSLTRSGTVGQVPDGYDDYSFKWKFITWDATFGTGDRQYTVPVLGYLVTGVKQPPSMPQNVEIDPGTDSVTLTWESGFNSAAYYEVCRYVENDPTGKYYYVRGTVNGSEAVDGVYTFTDTGLESGTQYQYTLRAVGLETTGGLLYSNYTELMSVVTASTAGTPKIVSQTSGVVNILPNTSTTFEVIATPAISSNSLSFQWQKRGAGENGWKNITNQEGYRLTVTGTTALDGTAYRCLVVELTSGSLPVFIYSEPVTLKVGKAGSTATLNVLNASNQPTTSGSADHSEATAGVPSQQTVVDRYEIKVGGNDTATVYEAYAASEDTYVYRNVADGKYYQLNGLSFTASGETGVYTGTADEAIELADLAGYLADSSNTIITNINNLRGTVQETETFDGVTYNVFTATGLAVQESDAPLQQSTLTLYQKADSSTDTNYYVAFYETQTGGTQVLKLDSTPLQAVTEDTTSTNFTYLSGTLQPSWTTGTQSITIDGESKECEVYTDGSVTVYKHTEYETIQVPVYDENGQETSQTETVKVVKSETYYYGTTTGEGETAVTTYSVLTPFTQGLYGVIDAGKTVSGTVTPGAVKMTTVSVPTTVMKKVDGDPVTLKVNISANGASTAGTVTFQITNTTTGMVTTMRASVRNGTASVTWTPPTEGVYTIRAIYGGSITASAAASNTITYYATAGSNALYDIQLPAAPQYGDTITPSLYQGTTAENMALVTSAVFTYHKYLGTGVSGTDSRGYATTGTEIPSGGISNLVSGDYLIKATVENEVKATKILSVSKRAIIVTVPNFTVSTEAVGSINWADKLKTIRVTDSDGTEYTLDAAYGTADNGYSNLFTLTQNLTATAGNYDVVVGYKSSTLQADFLSKYTPTINRCVATVTTSSYTVTYTAGSNGTLTANNITDGSQGFDTGATIKKNSTLLFNAAPADGFQVSKWTVKNATTGAEIATGFTIGTNSLTLNALSCDLVVTVEFSNEIYKVTYGTDTTGNGTVTAAQSGTTLVSGNTVVGGSSVTFTATPASGYVVKQWSVAKNNGAADVQLNPDGTAYTGTTLTLDNIDADTAVTVIFESAGDPFRVTYGAVKNESGSLVAANDVVNFTADGLTGGEAVKGSTVKLTATATPGTAIQEWQVSTNGTDWTTVAGSVKEYIIYNLQADTQVRVLVTTSSATYPVTFSIDGGDESAQLTALYNGGNISSGTNCMAYTTVVFTYTESENYELVRWDVSGTTGTEATDASNRKVHTYTIDSLDAATTVKAVVQKKPQITIIPSANGTITVTGTIEGVANQNIGNGKWVDCGTAITVTVEPTANYVVTGITAKTASSSVAASDTSNASTKASGAQTLTFTPAENVTITAELTEKPTVTVDSSVANGTVTFTGTKNGQTVTETSDDRHVDFGSSLAVTLKPDTGYEVNSPDPSWTAVANSDNYTYTIANVQTNQTITPAWSVIPQYAVNYYVVDTNGDAEGGTNGSLSASVSRKNIDAYNIDSFTSGGNVYRNSTVTFTAEPDSGYRVKEWRVNDEVVKTNGITDISNTLKLDDLSAGATVTVQFTKLGSNISVEAGDNGSIIGASVAGTPVDTNGFGLAEGASVTITVQPNTGYEVEQWMVNNIPVEGETGTTFTYTAEAGSAGAVIAVTFRQVEYSITWDGTNGTVTATGYTGTSADIRGGTEVTFTATPDEGYVITGWKVNSVTVDGQTGETFTWTVPNGKASDPVADSYTIEAVFERGSYAVTVNQPANGSISPNTEELTAVTGGTEVTFTATPDDGYIVIGWTVDGVTINTNDTTHKVTINKNTTVTAVIVPAAYEVTYSGGTGGTVTATGYDASPASVPYGESITFTAAPNAYYYVKEWQVDGVAVPDSANRNTYTLSDVTAAHTVTAVFAGAVTYEVGYEAGSNGSLSVTANSEALLLSPGQTVAVPGNSKLVFTAMPTGSDYMIAEWSVSKDKGSTYVVVTSENMASLGVTMSHHLANTLTIESLTSNITVKVEFKEIVEYDLPDDGADYTITDVSKAPEWTTEGKIREHGNVTFKVVPDSGMTITALTPSAGTATRNDDGSYTVTVTDVTANITLDVTVSAGIPLTIDCGANGSLSIKRGDDTLTTGDALQEGDVLAITAAPDTGYHLSTLTVNGDAITSGGTYTVSENDTAVIIAATFEKTEYRIRFNANGGRVSPTSATTTNGKLASLPTPVRSGYTFDGWYTKSIGGIQVTTDTVFTTNTTIYARWTADGTGGGSGGSGGSGGGGGSVPTYTITVEYAKHGDVISSYESAAKGTAIILNVVPDKDYILETLTVTDDSGYKLKLTENSGKYIFIMPDSNVTVKATFMKDNSMQNFFVDVPANAYYYDAVYWAVAKGITIGTGDGTTFSPNDPCTRAQVVTFLWRAAGCPEPKNAVNPFTDVKAGSYYETAVLWAVENGITVGTGDGTTFSPDDICSRAQIVTFLWRAQGTPAAGTGNPFKDVAVSAYYYDAVLWAVKNGVTMGTNAAGTMFSPDDICTRAQIVTFLWRVLAE